MKSLLRTTWALNLALCLAIVLLVPQTLASLFPAETTGYVTISETGVSPDQVRQVAERTGVEVAQVRHTTEYLDIIDDSLSTTSVEILGHDAHDYIRPPLDSLFLPESIVYSGSAAQDDALGGWHVIGDQDGVTQFIDQVRGQWGHRVYRSEILTAGRVRAAALSSVLGVSLLLAQASLGIVLALAAASQLAPYRCARLLGRSHASLALDLLKGNLLAACRWILLPLAALSLVVAYDVYASAVLSIHRTTAELIAWCAGLVVAATTAGTLAGWAVLAAGSRRRPGTTARPRYGLAVLTWGLALAMTWSFSTSSTTLVADVLDARTLRDQAQAQRSLPRAVSLGIWSVSENTFNALMPQIASFVAQANKDGRLVLAWAIPDGTPGDSSGPPTLYLNNTAAAHYGLPTVADNEVALYRPAALAGQDAALTQMLVDQARFNAQFGGTSGDITVVTHDQTEATAVLPADLPAVSYFLSSEGTRTSSCLIAVVPDGYFAPTDYLSAITQGAAVFTGQTVYSLREELREHHVEGLVARLDSVGAVGTALRTQTTQTLILHALILLASAAGTVVSCGLAARAWAQARRRRREISQLLGQRRLTEHLVTAALIIPPALVLIWPLLTLSAPELVVTQSVCALVLVGAVVLGARPTRTHRHDRRTIRHG